MASDMIRVANDPRYVRLVRLRSRCAWALTTLVVTLYTGFILLVALDKPFLARPVAGTVSLGIPVGFAMIFVAVGTIAAFSALANRYFDPRMAEILTEDRA